MNWKKKLKAFDKGLILGTALTFLSKEARKSKTGTTLIVSQYSDSKIVTLITISLVQICRIGKSILIQHQM